MIRPFAVGLACLAASPVSAALVEDQISSLLPTVLRANGGVPAPLTQTFTPSVSNIAGIDVLVTGSFSPGETEIVTLDLFGPAGSPVFPVPLTESLAAEDHNSLLGSVIEFRFAPIAITPGALHSFTVDVANDFLVIGVDATNNYGGGKVIAGDIAPGSIDDNDVIFRTLYDDTLPIPLPAAGWMLLGALGGLLGWRGIRRGT